MTFPQKNTREIHVDDLLYLWHLNDDWETRNSWIVVARKDHENGQMLFIDPYHHDILPTPEMVASAIRFSIGHGWDPLIKGQPVRLAYNGESFEILPEGTGDWEHHLNLKYLQ
ncbi:MAG: hypothetical protein CVV44_10910 [Spirochaetae bacterium HGW-Spirochaetae-1]|jgi:hypothetical protein|nr:MAG: hypothetical protein CVV44_10910 [Spirochaetae bacterium HGW-Spirochaetae-1]